MSVFVCKPYWIRVSSFFFSDFNTLGKNIIYITHNIISIKINDYAYLEHINAPNHSGSDAAPR